MLTLMMAFRNFPNTPETGIRNSHFIIHAYHDHEFQMYQLTLHQNHRRRLQFLYNCRYPALLPTLPADAHTSAASRLN